MNSLIIKGFQALLLIGVFVFLYLAGQAFFSAYTVAVKSQATTAVTEDIAVKQAEKVIKDVQTVNESFKPSAAITANAERVLDSAGQSGDGDRLQRIESSAEHAIKTEPVVSVRDYQVGTSYELSEAEIDGIRRYSDLLQ